ncbi:hypothetical protein KXD40_002902 [Peronospora effusa]|uniref:AB hydrolase-1 domain-containing protein n=1 Tax=Peronospora effusa TaxID=542832 RepID=A0A3M6VLX7_9STRA|nr:hypothetical protein DD238_003293 [Peronospora effusa]RQM15984.1 hypothetical protein DD237_004445 [Peronospora effusa]UIZ29272.1 hypothetical protein KXD40_002902 [Peronospora effusa]CAI5701706.1 unnamed protein product [Peronospora effusa]
MDNTPQYECAEFRVPMCYDDVCKSDNTIDVFVKRVVATTAFDGQKEKALWVLQGGPGASSTGVEGLMNTMYLQLEREVSVYTFDHRGTGRSARLVCQAAQAGGLGSPGGLAIRLDELPACMDDIRFQIDNQTAAFSVTSAAKDLAAIINYELSDQDVYVYGLSYGTYMVERLMHFTPASVRGFAVDGIVSESGESVESRATFSNWDRDVGIVGDRFLAACMVDEFCKSKFSGVTDLVAFVHELYDKLDAAVADGKSGINACADALAKNGKKPSYLLRSAFGEYLMSDHMRIAIPAVIYRASRCTDQDADALSYFVDKLRQTEEDDESGNSEPETLLFDSDMLYYLIVFSEMWEYPTPDKATLVSWYENSTMASDNYLSLPYYCLFTGSREHACQELIHLPVARPLVYERDQYWNKTTELPDGVTALLMTGGMDLQTRRMYGELEYKMMAGERMLVSFDDAGHCTTFTTPTNGGGVTCGVRILTSYVKENGELKNVNTSCMDDLKPITFLDKAVGGQEVFGKGDLYENSETNGQG